MTREEYNEKMSAFIKEYQIQTSKLKKQHADANNPYKVGDIIEDHYQRILIRRIEYTVGRTSTDPYECKYIGPMVKKDGTPYKTGKEGVIYQSNIKKQ